MFDKFKFKAIVEDRGMLAKDVAEDMGISQLTLSFKVTGRTDFTLKEIEAIQDILKLSRDERDAMFFGD